MSSAIQEFKEAFNQQKPYLELYGKFIVDTIKSSFKEQYPNISPYEVFKVEPKHRVKEVESLISKAFYRGKNYQDPLNDITDKVGSRFIVLTVDFQV